MSIGTFGLLAVTALVALVAVLAVRTGLAERAAGSGDRARSGWSRPVAVRRLDAAAVVLVVLGVATLLATVVTGLG